MKNILTFLLMLTFSVGAMAQDKKAEIKFVTEEIDYGTILFDSDGVRTFEFKNTGEAPLVISSASSSCGCTVPSWPKEPILPGQKGKIEVKYDTKRIGDIRKTITIVSNAAETPTIALRIKGTIVTELPKTEAPAKSTKKSKK